MNALLAIQHGVPLPPFVSINPLAGNSICKLREAECWVETARPLIDAYLTIYALHDAAYSDDSYAGREVRSIYAAAQERLYVEIEATRDAAVNAARPGLQDDPDMQETADEFSDWIGEEVTSVDAALRAARKERLL